MPGYPPAHDHPAERVGDEADVGHTGPGGHERQIGHPELVGCGGGEVPAHQIGMPGRGGVGFGGADLSAATSTGDAGGPHVPGDLITSDVVASTAGCFPQFTGTVDAIVVFPEPPQRRPDDLVAAGSRAGWTRPIRVVGARGHLHPC